MTEWDDLRRGGLAKAKRAIATLDPQHAEALLADARRALGAKPKLRELRALRELVALALEVATPTAVDMAIEWSLIVSLRTKPSARARRALFARVSARLSSMKADEANRVLSVLVMRATMDADADDVTLALLRAVVDDGRIERWQRSIAVHHMACHSFSNAGEPRSGFVEALVARCDLDFVDRRDVIRALLAGEPAQVYEELAPRYRSRREPVLLPSVDDDGNERQSGPHAWREWIGPNLDARADPRWVDEALRLADFDPKVAAQTLGKLATPRAREELLQWAEATAFDERVGFALDALGMTGDVRATPIILRWLERPEGAAHTAKLVDVLTKTAHVDHLGAIQALIAKRPHHAQELERALDACRARGAKA